MSTLGRKYHPGDVPERVLGAARALLEQMPAADISVRELAREAGVSHAAPYRHFSDRPGFVTALSVVCFKEFIEAQRVACESAGQGEKLLEVGKAYVRYATNHPYAFALIFDPSLSPNGITPAAHVPLIASHAIVLGASLDDAITTGRLPDHTPPGDLADAMWSAAHGLAGLVITGQIPPERVPAVLAALLNQPQVS